jgi:hypothetical protein
MELIKAINWIITNHYNGNTRTNILVLDTEICFWNTSILESIETFYGLITIYSKSNNFSSTRALTESTLANLYHLERLQPNFLPTISASIYPDTLPFAEKAIRWYRELLLHPEKANDMTGFDNGILIAYGMCPPCPLQEFYQMAPEHQPTHFMRGTAAEIWGTDTHKIMYMTAADWETD